MPKQINLADEKNLKSVLGNVLENLKKTLVNGFPDEVVAKNKLQHSTVIFDRADNHLKATQKIHASTQTIRLQYESLESKKHDLEDVTFQKDHAQDEIYILQDDVHILNKKIATYEKGDNYKNNEKYINLVKQRNETNQSIDQYKIDIAAGNAQIESLNNDITVLNDQLIPDSRNNLIANLAGSRDISQMKDSKSFQLLENAYHDQVEVEKADVIQLKMSKNSDFTEWENKKNNNIKAKSNLKKAVNDVDSYLSNYQLYGDYDELKEKLNTLKKVSPGVHKDIIGGVVDAADYQAIRNDLDTIQNKLVKQFKKSQLSKPGDSHSVDLTITGGVGFGVAGAGVGVTISCKVNFVIKKTADGRIVQSTAKVGSLKVSGKVGLDDLPAITSKIEADINGKLKWTSSDHFEFVEDYVTKKSGTIALGFLESSKKVMKVKNSAKKPSKILSELEDRVEANQLNLEKKLKLTGVISQEQQIKPVRKENVAYFSRKKFDKEISIGAVAVFKASDAIAVGASGRLLYSNAKSHDYKSLNFLDDAIANPALQKIHALKAPTRFGFTQYSDDSVPKYLPGAQAITAMEELEVKIKDLQENGDPENQLIEKRKKLAKSIAALRYEYDAYVNTFNDQQINNNKFDQSVLNTLQEIRSSKNNAEYVKSMSLQFSMLKRLYDGTFSENEQKTDAEQNLTSDFINELKTPKMKFKESEIQKEFGTDAQTPDTLVTKKTGKISVNMKALKTIGTGVSITATKLYTKKPHRPKENNIILKIKLNTNVGFKAGSDEHQQYMIDLFENANIKRLFSEDNKAPDLKTDILPALKNLGDGEIEINFVKRANGYALKTLKGYKVADNRVSGKADIPPGSPIQAKVGIELGTKHIAMETVHLGDATLMAIPFAYRAKKIRGSQESWDAYKVQSDIVNKFCRRLRKEKLSGKEGTLTGDLAKWKQEFIEQKSQSDIDMIEKVYTALDEYANDESNENLIKMANALDKAIDRKTKTEDQAWRDSFEATRKINSIDIRNYVANNIAKRFDKTKTEFNLDNQNIKDVDSLVKHSVNNHNEIVRKIALPNQENEVVEQLNLQLEKSKKLVKRAMAMDYDLNKLNDLTDQGNAKENNIAIANLNDRIENGIDDTIYVNDRADGKLSFAPDGKIQVRAIVNKGNERIIQNSDISTAFEQKFGKGKYSQFTTKFISKSDTQENWEQNYDSKSAKKYSKSYRSSFRKSGFRKRKPTAISDIMKQVMKRSLNRNAPGNQGGRNVLGGQNRRASNV